MILPDVARAIGIPESVKVITGAPDLQNAAVASGCVEPLQAHMGMGTSAWVSCPVTFKKSNVITQIASVPGIGDGNYLIANNQDNAGRALEWYRQAVCPDMSYRDLEAEAATSPAGSHSVIFTPWLNGERSPVDDRYARGGFHNLSLDATRADMTRAVLEGVAMNMKWLLQSAERFAGAKFDTIRLMGGCAQIDLWCQILADVCDRRLERIEQPLVAGLRGAAIYFGLVEGSISRADVHGLIPIDTVFTPNPDHRAIYDRLFAHFPGLHSRNKRMFQALNG
jgi:xylulokinase